MAAGSGSGRRVLAIGAVLCAVCGLVLAASAMPMVASESPANGLLEGADSGAGDAATAQQSAAQAQAGSTAESGSGAGTGGAEMGDGALGGTLADRAASADNPALRGALYGLASLASLFGGDSSAPAGDSGGERSAGPAAAGVDGEFGEALDSSAGTDDSGTVDGTDRSEETDGTTGDGERTTTDGGDGSGTDDGSGTGDGETAGDGSTVEDGDGSTDAGSDSGDDSSTTDDADDTTGGSTESDGSGDPGETGSDGGTGDDTGSTAESGAGTASDPSAAADGGENGGTDGGAGGDESSGETVDGADESGLGDDVPGLSSGAPTAAAVALALAVLGYVFYTREDPIGTLRSLPGRLVSLALAGVVGCSQAVERAVGRLRGLRSIAELPGLVAATFRDALSSAETRLRDAGSSLPIFGDEPAAEDESVGETQVSARERIRRAFESVIDASPMYRASAATATPAEVAHRARNAGAPREPVETITDSFRDVEYGDRDPEPYLERTTTAHDRLRSALEADREAADADAPADSASVGADERTGDGGAVSSESTEGDARE